MSKSHTGEMENCSLSLSSYTKIFSNYISPSCNKQVTTLTCLLKIFPKWEIVRCNTDEWHQQKYNSYFYCPNQCTNFKCNYFIPIKTHRGLYVILLTSLCGEVHTDCVNITFFRGRVPFKQAASETEGHGVQSGQHSSSNATYAVNNTWEN